MSSLGVVGSKLRGGADRYRRVGVRTACAALQDRDWVWVVIGVP